MLLFFLQIQEALFWFLPRRYRNCFAIKGQFLQEDQLFFFFWPSFVMLETLIKIHTNHMHFQQALFFFFFLRSCINAPSSVTLLSSDGYFET